MSTHRSLSSSIASGSSALLLVAVLGSTGALTACGTGAFGEEVAPIVAIASPGPGAWLRGEVAVRVDFMANADHYQRVEILLDDAVLAEIPRVDLFQKDTLEATIDVSAHPDGEARLTAQAINLVGQPNGSWTNEVFIVNGDTGLPVGGDGDGDGDVDLGEDPAVDIVSPQDGARVTLGGMTSIDLGLGAQDTVVKVELFAGDAPIGTLREGPWSFAWDTTALPPGPVKLKAVAYFAGNVILEDNDTTVILAVPGSEGDTTPPSVTALEASRESPVPEGVTLTITATVSDDVAVARVDLIDTAAGTDVLIAAMEPGDSAGTFEATWSTAGQLGTHSLVAVATDPAGNQGTGSPLSIEVVDASTIDDNEAPTVGTLTIDPDGSVEQGASVNLAVTASDDVGLSGVELYVDGVPVGGFDGAEPDFSLTWSTAGRSGTLELEARALDLAGNLTASNTVQLTVTGGGIDWTPPAAHPFAKVNSFPTNTSGDQGAPNPGNLSMYLHVPDDLPPGAPVIMVMHGCSQTASQFRNQSGWTDLADDEKFIVIFPEQTITSDPNPQKLGNPYRCFNWAGYYGERWARGEGENQSLKEMIDWVLTDPSLGADAGKVFVTGFSAGGGMTSLMLATWPEVFAGGAVMSGIPYGCANSRDTAFGCMGVQDNASFSPRTGAGCESGEACMAPELHRDPAAWGDLVRGAGAPGYSGPYPKVMIWQGDNDQYVDDDNAVELMEQWTDVHGTGMTPSFDGVLVDGADPHTYQEFSVDGDVKVATVTMHGLAHGIAVDPGSGEGQGGTSSNNVFSGGYSFDRDMYAMYEAADFWGILGWADGIVIDPGPDPEPGIDPEPGVDPEPDATVGGCADYEMTVQYHLYSFPARVENVGDFLNTDYRVVGSGESLNDYNIYLDLVTIRTTDVEGEFELGACP